ncbi:MAG: hypothetical protein DDT32_01492 [Syntrophomonadaceae bacterium]|nr:hypothetical protein [Bacillota bacterium]
MRIYLATNNSTLDGYVLSLETSGVLRVVGSACVNEGLLTKLTSVQPDVVIISSVCAGIDPIKFVTDIRTTLSELRVIFIADNEDIFPQLIGVGIYDLFITDQFKLSDINERLFHPASYANVIHFLKNKPDCLLVNRLRRNEIVVFWSPSGGTGKSTLALNYALMRSGNVLLIDLDIQTPVLDLYAGISSPRKDLYELLVQELLTTDVLRQFLLPIVPRVVSHQLLPGFVDLNRFDAVGIGHFKRLLEFVVPRFDCVVVDINSCPFIDATYVALNAADTVYVVTINDYASLREAVRYQKYFTDNLMMAPEKFRVVVNKHIEQGTDVTNMSSKLPLPITTIIPYSPLIAASTCTGKPFVLFNERSLRKTIDAVSQMTGQSTVKRRRFFGNC